MTKAQIERARETLRRNPERAAEAAPSPERAEALAPVLALYLEALEEGTDPLQVIAGALSTGMAIGAEVERAAGSERIETPMTDSAGRPFTLGFDVGPIPDSGGRKED